MSRPLMHKIGDLIIPVKVSQIESLIVWIQTGDFTQPLPVEIANLPRHTDPLREGVKPGYFYMFRTLKEGESPGMLSAHYDCMSWSQEAFQEEESSYDATFFFKVKQLLEHNHGLYLSSKTIEEIGSGDTFQGTYQAGTPAEFVQKMLPLFELKRFTDLDG